MFTLELLFERVSRIRLLRASAFDLKAYKKVVRQVQSKILNLLACSYNTCFTFLLIILKRTLLRRLKNRQSQIYLYRSQRNKRQKIFYIGVVKTFLLLIRGSCIRSLKAKIYIFLKGLDYLQILEKIDKRKLRRRVLTIETLSIIRTLIVQSSLRYVLSQ